MVYSIQPPQNVLARINLPASKSISNRVLILNALCKNDQPIENLSDSDDTRAMLKAFEQGRTADIDVGAAGTSMRFLTAFLAQSEGECTITGTERMKNRPIKILVDALRQAGGEIEYLEKEGFPPLRIFGRSLTGGAVRLNGSVSSQYLSALMMIAPCMRQGLRISLEGNIVSEPYIEMTMKLMRVFGVETFRKGQDILIEPQSYRPTAFKVENDWSAASYWYEIALLAQNARIELLGLEQESVQGDAKCAEIFAQTGVKTAIQSTVTCLTQAKSETCRSLLYDFTQEPDLAQTLVVSCCFSDIPFRFTGLQSLRIKETDRIFALQTELRKWGFLLKTGDASMEWSGERCEPVPEPVVSTYEDHRMAMAFAPACLKTGKIKIEDPGVVSKSYPRFWDDLKKAGFSIA